MSDAWLNFQDGEFYVASGGVAENWGSVPCPSLKPPPVI